MDGRPTLSSLTRARASTDVLHFGHEDTTPFVTEVFLIPGWGKHEAICISKDGSIVNPLFQLWKICRGYLDKLQDYLEIVAKVTINVTLRLTTEISRK